MPTRLDNETEDKGKATDVLGAVVAAVQEKGLQQGYSLRPNKTCREANKVNCVYNKMSRPMRMAGGNEDKGNATDALDCGGVW